MKKNISKNDQRSTINDQHLKIDINHVAKLANLTLSPAEKKIFARQLGDILGYFDQLKKINTEKIEPIGQITSLINVTREDTAAPSLPQEDALANAPRTHNGFFEVDAVFEERSEM